MRGKLAPTAVNEEKQLLYRLMEHWVFFWGTVLPQLEGVFLPLQRDVRSVGVSLRCQALIVYRNVIVLPNIEKLQGEWEK